MPACVIENFTALHFQAKIINKERVIKTRQVEHTFNEKNILFAMENNFIVKLFDYFQVRRGTTNGDELAWRSRKILS